ncbi:hypothetical protein ACM5ME_12315 [Bacillus subtilis]|uniref:hypothetical protein n=1 Tax=Bacillus subtilis TaxID=1423 RepID=UPI0019D4D392
MTNTREKQKLLYEFNKTEAVSPKAFTLHGLFERQAAVTPERLAIRFSGGSLTYAELDMYARAGWLRTLRHAASQTKVSSGSCLNAHLTC